MACGLLRLALGFMHTPLAFPPPPSSGSPTPPMALSSRLRVLERLGAGRRSDVLLAIARGPMGFERPVVIKRPAPGLSGNDLESVRRELLREATAYSRASHPTLVRLYDFVEDAGLPTLVLEHIDGLSVARIVTNLRARSEVLDDASALFIGYRLFLALTALHGARDPLTREFAAVIHRDVCPANVLVPWDGFARLCDLGDARLGGTLPDTRPGERHGTMGYLAPEQVRGERATVRTDVYSACIVLRELLLREPAFSREGRTEAELLRAMADADLMPIEHFRSDLPRDLVWALGVGLTRDPERRALAAEDMAEILRRAVDVERARRGLADRLVPLRSRASGLHHTPTMPDTDTELDASDADLGCDDPGETPLTLTPAPRRRDSKYARLRDSQQADTSRPPSFPESAVVAVSPIAPPAPRLPQLVVATPPPIRPQWSSAPPALVYEPPTPSQELRRPVSTARILLFAAAASVAAGALIGGVFAFHENRGAKRDALSSASSPTTAPSRVSAPTREAPPAVPAPPVAPVVSAAPRAALTAPATASPPPRAAAPATTPTPSDAPATAPLAKGTGRILTDRAERGHRVWIDGRMVGSGGAPLITSCGWRRVRVGSRGRLKQVFVPCGGDVNVRR